MKTKLKPLKVSTERAVATLHHAPVVPLNDRRLTFGSRWDYASAPEDSKNYVIPPRHGLFINGKFGAPHSGKHFDTINPATEDKITCDDQLIRKYRGALRALTPPELILTLTKEQP